MTFFHLKIITQTSVKCARAHHCNKRWNGFEMHSEKDNLKKKKYYILSIEQSQDQFSHISFPTFAFVRSRQKHGNFILVHLYTPYELNLHNSIGTNPAASEWRNPSLAVPVQKGVSKGIEFPERFLSVHHQRISRYNSLALPIHHSNEAICCRLRPDPHTGKILLQQIPAARGSKSESHRWV